MPENTPPRRWYQFRLSTILVLVGIAAWAMAMLPLWTSMEELQRQIDLLVANEKNLSTLGLNDANPYPKPERFDVGIRWRLEKAANRLQGPILALAVFLTWKFAWSIAARREGTVPLI